MKELVQWLDFHLNFSDAFFMHLFGLLTTARPVLLRLASRTNRHVELSNLVSVLTWRGHLDWAGPVEVEVTEGVCQLLDVCLGQS